ncbi:MAG: serine hydrolase [Crocinitomicaceae bacterium]|nr:serine hydrolase [Crocinitomicaceae bacterium]MBK8924714.1 serine hydrolase [Crocinitomicaceae bacterium]
MLVALLSKPAWSQKVDSVKLEFLVNEAERLYTEALIIYQADSLVIEEYFGVGHPDSLTELMSCTKGIVALAVICLLEDELIDSIQTPVYVFYPEWNCGLKKNVTLEHLLTMTSGLQDYRNTNIEIYPSNNFIDLALSSDLVEIPGEKFRYNNKSTNLLSGIIEIATGRRMDYYIADRIFKPLGIEEFKWALDSSGNPMGMAGCQLKASDFVKIGILIANDGLFNGQQILSKENIKKITTPGKNKSDYGYLWWLTYDQTELCYKTEILEELCRLGASFSLISHLELLLKEYNSKPLIYYRYHEEILNYWWKLVTILGPNNLAYIYKHVSPENKITRQVFKGEIRSISARGWLGNYLVIDLTSKIVGVRTISYRSFSNKNNFAVGEENFLNFERLVTNILKED